MDTDAPPADDRKSWFFAIAVSVAAIWFLFFHVPYSFGYGSVAVPLAKMLWALWNDYGDWQHGMLVPFIVGWLVYRERDSLAHLPVKGEALGLVGAVLALALYWAGYKADVQYAGFLSAQLLLASGVLWLLGWAWFKALLFPLGFIVFMWPFLFLDSMIAFPLRIVMAEISFRFLDLIGMDVIREGSGILSAPDFANGVAAGERFKVDIADPCSGIRSLFALLMISAIYAQLKLRAIWKKWFLFAMAVPLAIAGNFFRILMLTFGTLWFGSEFAIGTIDSPSVFHMFAGFAVFGVALAGMAGICRLLQIGFASGRDSGTGAESAEDES